MSKGRNRKTLAGREGLTLVLLLTLVMAGPVDAASEHPLTTLHTTLTFKMPSCPIKAHTVPPTKTAIQLPSGNPNGKSSLSIAGTLQVTDQSGSTVILLAPSLALDSTQLSFARTVKTLQHATGQLTFDRGCTKTDPYGSNNCTWEWGQKITEARQGALQEDITAGKLVVDLKIDTTTPLQFTCPVCGGPCTVSVPQEIDQRSWLTIWWVMTEFLHHHDRG